MRNKKKQKILLAMSGGVDSSVAAALLLEQGYEVIGGFMKNWTCEVTGECDWRTERRDAMRVAALLDIPLHTFDFEAEYRQYVVDYMVSEYEAGRTPNPDVMCNKFIKFDMFLREADKLGCDLIATGHYTRVEEKKGKYHILKGVDTNKDQSYFLWTLGQDVLSRTLFPVGGFDKPEIRKIAARHNLPVAEKKDSQGICFIGEVDLKDFLARRIKPKQGKIVTVEGENVGQHEGIHNYTIGQRHGFGGGGGEMFVVEKRVPTNELVVAPGKDNPALFKNKLQSVDLNWVGTPPESPLECMAKIRYRQTDQKCTLLDKQGPLTLQTSAQVIFDTPQRAISPGQSIVFYQGDELIGGGIINN